MRRGRPADGGRKSPEVITYYMYPPVIIIVIIITLDFIICSLQQC